MKQIREVRINCSPHTWTAFGDTEMVCVKCGQVIKKMEVSDSD